MIEPAAQQTVPIERSTPAMGAEKFAIGHAAADGETREIRGTGPSRPGYRPCHSRRNIMSKLVWTAVVALGLSSTPVMAQSAGRILGGAGIGAAGGAVAGAVIPGLSVGEGAAIGAVG